MLASDIDGPTLVSMVYADVMATGSAGSPADTVLITKLVMAGSPEVNMVVLHYILCYKYVRNNNKIRWKKTLITKGHFDCALCVAAYR